MKTIHTYLLLFFTLFSFNASAQILDPISWEFETLKISEDEYELIFIAELDPKWAVYSQFIDAGNAISAPIPTSFNFNLNKSFDLIGGVIEDSKNRVTELDPQFKIIVSKFYNQAKFTQKVKVINPEIPISGEIVFIVCNDTQCVFPAPLDFNFEFVKKTNSKIEQNEVILNDYNELLYGYKLDEIIDARNNNDIRKSDANEDNNNTLLGIFGLGFIGGLLALLTPCIFPMIPLTVSFFTKKSSKNGTFNAILYGLFIVLVYLALSIPFHLLDSVNPDILNEISTNITLNVIFFLIFLFFAFSFFGYYELTLPSSWVEKSTKGESFGGILGIFFMALTLAVVSFSCTGPILGSLLASSITSDGGAWQLTSGMAGFGVALGLPFALFAMFPKMLMSLPKSGGWLNTVKVVLGFIELALALKFLSNADLVAHWGLLKIEVFLFLWFLISLGLTLYLLGLIKFPHDSKIKKFSFIRISSIILAFSFSIYLATGFKFNKETSTFKPLSLLSGLAPPVGYSLLYPNDCPNNLDCFKDLKTGIDHATELNKPILLDFTGYACVNCRKMEEHIWPLPNIDKIIRNDYVLISLYVDDKKSLPENEQVQVQRKSSKQVRTLKNFGHKWAHFQTEFFQTNSQPYYVLLSPDGKEILNTFNGYTDDEKEYLRFLEDGLKNFDSKKINFNIN